MISRNFSAPQIRLKFLWSRLDLWLPSELQKGGAKMGTINVASNCPPSAIAN
jgi:hypothetical protein